MAIKTTNVTVDTTPTVLVSGADSDGDAGQGVSVLNTGSSTIYLGGADVTADTAATTGGRPLVAGDVFDFDTHSGNDQLYGRVVSGTGSLHVFRTGA